MAQVLYISPYLDSYKVLHIIFYQTVCIGYNVFRWTIILLLYTRNRLHVTYARTIHVLITPDNDMPKRRKYLYEFSIGKVVDWTKTDFPTAVFF